MAKNKPKKASHWTDNDESFKYFLAADFITQFEAIAESSGINQAEVASRIGVTPGRISQIINNPGNLTIETMVSLSRAVGAKSAFIVYSDNDPTNKYGPLSGSIFTECWKLAGSPAMSINSDLESHAEVSEYLTSPSQSEVKSAKFVGLDDMISVRLNESKAA